MSAARRKRSGSPPDDVVRGVMLATGSILRQVENGKRDDLDEYELKAIRAANGWARGYQSVRAKGDFS